MIERYMPSEDELDHLIACAQAFDERRDPPGSVFYEEYERAYAACRRAVIPEDAMRICIFTATGLEQWDVRGNELIKVVVNEEGADHAGS